jgi:magnesium-transporting ATPase (P-type)
MKRVILLSALLLCILIGSLVTGADPLKGIEHKTKEIDVVSKKLASPNRADYVKEAWTDYLNKSKVGGYLREADRQLRSLDFAWKFLVGMPFSWSFHFLLAFVFWIALGIWIYRLLSFLELWNHTMHGIIAFISSTSISVIGLDRELAGFIAGLVLKIPVFWYQLCAEIAILICISYLTFATKIWEQAFKNIKASWEEKQLKEDVKELKEEKKERDATQKWKQEQGLENEE